uniref:Putative secreted protein n=1 Tax=Ixodes ricinus TaxID=34613 RepID=A0A6B0UH84_IXORI
MSSSKSSSSFASPFAAFATCFFCFCFLRDTDAFGLVACATATECSAPSDSSDSEDASSDSGVLSRHLGVVRNSFGLDFLVPVVFSAKSSEES